MKIAIIGAVALVAGVVLGVATSRWELPHEPSPAVAYAHAAAEAMPAPGKALGPRVNVVNGELHDFGEMDRYGKASFAFILKNDGDAPLTIKKGETTCKCTVSDLKSGQLLPGEQTEVRLEWTAKTSDPIFSQSAEIATNDPARVRVRLMVRGKVHDSVRFDRQELKISSISQTEDTVAKMRIYGFREEPLKIVGHEWTSAATADHFAASFRELAPAEFSSEADAKSGVEMTVTVKSGLPFGPLAQTIRLTTNYEGVSAIEAPIVGSVAGDITLVGPSFNSKANLLDMQSTLSQEGKSVVLRAIVKGPHRDATEFSVKSIEPADALQVTIGEATRTEKLVTFPLTVTIPPGTAPCNHLGNGDTKPGAIVLATTNPNAEQIVLKVKFAVQASP